MVDGVFDDLDSRSADAWMICLFFAFKTPQVIGTNNTRSASLAKVTFFVNTAPKL